MLMVSLGQTTGKAFTKKRFKDTLKDVNNYNLVAQMDKNVVGYLFGFGNSGHSIRSKFYRYLSRFIINSEHGNFGTGNTLVEQCFSELRKFGYTNVSVGEYTGST